MEEKGVVDKFIDTSGVDWDRLTKFRRNMHEYPEGGFEEFETKKKVIEHLKSIGVQEKFIKFVAQTGIVVDIENPEGVISDGPVNCIALRGDMDALLMKEETGLAYSSKTNYAHMCGHDGHTTCLLSIAEYLMQHRSKIPKGKRIRLLFQPAEEGPGGARPMIEEGCLEGVDEVYGYHNFPSEKVGTVMCTPGNFMASVALIKIVLTGKGGHGSAPHNSISPIGAACDIYKALTALPAQEVDCQESVVLTITKLQSGTRNNVIPREAVLEGTIRGFNTKIMDFLIKRIKEIVTSIAKAYRLEVDEDELASINYPPVINHPTEAAHIARIAKATFGDENFTENGLPCFASEDFSQFIIERPGAFFFLGSKYEGQAQSLHSSYFNYPDSLTPVATLFYSKLIEDRLGFKFNQ